MSDAPLKKRTRNAEKKITATLTTDEINVDKQARILKRQLRQAQNKVIARFKKTGYNVLDSNDDPFSFIGVRGVDIRFVRVIIGPADVCLIRRIGSISCPTNCTKEIWEQTGGDFTFRELGTKFPRVASPASANTRRD